MRPLDPKKVKYIVIHCLATPEGLDVNANDVNRMHKSRGWSMIGYHYLIRLNGKIEEGRPIDKQGAGVRGHNDDSIHISYAGGLDHARKPKDTRTPEQQVAMVNLLTDLKSKFSDATILGHRDLSPDLDGDGVVEKHEWVKECPCFSPMKEYDWLNFK